MGTLIVVEGDKVEGTDKHNVSGTGPDSATNSVGSFTGIADFDYKGSMTDDLSDFVSIDGKAVVLVTSKSSLDPGEHLPISAQNITQVNPTTVTPALVASIDDTPIGTGTPSSGSGSSFVKVGGDATLLDSDSIDTCDGKGSTENSTVTAENQDFVSCSE
ncbi:MAG: hypothetical protein OEV42_07870 [Deltaproteobacteria bacterium]|nr:hypothetical protein [Deltaproteobacteria bacterium]